jgi:hypothetical protein
MGLARRDTLASTRADTRLLMAEAIPFNKVAKSRAGLDVSADEFLAFERLLFELSSKLANLAGDEFETEIQSAISRVRPKHLRRIHGRWLAQRSVLERG